MRGGKCAGREEEERAMGTEVGGCEEEDEAERAGEGEKDRKSVV